MLNAETKFQLNYLPTRIKVNFFVSIILSFTAFRESVLKRTNQSVICKHGYLAVRSVTEGNILGEI